MEMLAALVETGKELKSWGERNAPHISMSDKAAGLILAYMHDNDVMLYIGQDNLLKQRNKMGEFTDTTLDDVIDMVCEWNYEAIEDAKWRQKNPRNFIDFCKAQELEKELDSEKMILNVVFQDTVYGKDVKDMALNLALDTMKRLHLVPILDIPMYDDKKLLKDETALEKLLVETPVAHVPETYNSIPEERGRLR